METEILDKLYLELSQVSKARTARESFLLAALYKANGICRSMHAIAARPGEANWEAFRTQLDIRLAEQHAILWPNGEAVMDFPLEVQS